MCHTRRDEATEYEVLRRAQVRARKEGQTKPKSEKREKKPLTEKVKEMVAPGRTAEKLRRLAPGQLSGGLLQSGVL